MNNWRTPPEIYDPLNDEFHFDLDAAADATNTKCQSFLTDALSSGDWPGDRVWCNPPYGRMLDPFVRRCCAESRKGKLVVALIPMRVRAAWWHESVIGKAREVRCIRKRPRFIRPDGVQPKLTGTVDSCLVIWDGRDGGMFCYTRLTSFTGLR